MKGKTIHETNKGEIKIIEFEGANYVVAKTHISIDLATKFGKKYNAVVPNLYIAMRFVEQPRYNPTFCKHSNFSFKQKYGI